VLSDDHRNGSSEPLIPPAHKLEMGGINLHGALSYADTRASSSSSVEQVTVGGSVHGACSRASLPEILETEGGRSLHEAKLYR
jgi:hypothetical protein